MYALRSSARNAKKVVNNLSRRNMGGHAAPVEYEGIDKVVRGVFPEDWQLATAILGGYTVLIMVGKASMGGGEGEAPKVTAAAAPSLGDAIPSVESSEFEKFIENESNLMKWVDSVSK